MSINVIEKVVSFLGVQGYWIRKTTTLVLTDADREAIDAPHMLNPKISVLAYRPPLNQLVWVESMFEGIATIDAFTGRDLIGASRYIVFTNEQYRKIVSHRLVEQLVQDGLVLPGVSIRYALWSKIDPSSLNELERYFRENDWLLFNDEARNQWAL